LVSLIKMLTLLIKTLQCNSVTSRVKYVSKLRILLRQEHCKQSVDIGRVTTTESQQSMRGSHQSDESVSLTSLYQCALSDGDHVYLCLQNTTLSWHGSVCSHQRGHHEALVCSQKAGRVHDMTRRTSTNHMQYWLIAMLEQNHNVPHEVLNNILYLYISGILRGAWCQVNHNFVMMVFFNNSLILFFQNIKI